MRIDVDHPFPGARILLNNMPVPFVHSADDIAGVIEHWVDAPHAPGMQLVQSRGWVTILPPPRPHGLAPPFICLAPWNQHN